MRLYLYTPDLMGWYSITVFVYLYIFRMALPPTASAQVILIKVDFYGYLFSILPVSTNTSYNYMPYGCE